MKKKRGSEGHEESRLEHWEARHTEKREVAKRQQREKTFIDLSEREGSC